jgi:hypothetical protein
MSATSSEGSIAANRKIACDATKRSRKVIPFSRLGMATAADSNALSCGSRIPHHKRETTMDELMPIAWSARELDRGGPAPYTKRHLHRPGAAATLCNYPIPKVAFDFDAAMATDRCKSCEKRARLEGRGDR